MSGRRYAYVGVTVGLVVSVTANVADAMAVPGGAEPGALFLAGFWPLALYLALEVLTRTRWTAGRGLLLARVGVAAVAAVAAVVSYLHLHGLLVHYGEARFPALIGPAGIDGLMVVSAAALLNGDGDPEPVPAATEPVPVPQALPAAPVAPEPAPAPERPPRVATAPPQARKPSGRPAAARAGKATDADLLGRVTAAVDAGQIGPHDVTGNRCRSLLSIGAGRASRIAEAWHESQRLADVRPLRTASAGE